MRSTLRRDASAVIMDAGRNVGVGVPLINAVLLLPGVLQAAIAAINTIKSNANLKVRLIGYLPCVPQRTSPSWQALKTKKQLQMKKASAARHRAL